MRKKTLGLVAVSAATVLLAAACSSSKGADVGGGHRRAAAARLGATAASRRRPDGAVRPGGDLGGLERRRCPRRVGLPDDGRIGQIVKAGHITVGIDVNTELFGYDPHHTGVPQGFDVDIARMVGRAIFPDFDKNPTRVEYRVVTLAGAQNGEIPQLNAGKVDLVVRTTTITCARLKNVSFSNPYYIAAQKLLMPLGTDSQPQHLSLAQLKGKGMKVCATNNSTPYKTIVSTIGAAYAVGVDNALDCLALLEQHQVAGISTDDAILHGMEAQDPRVAITTADGDQLPAVRHPDRQGPGRGYHGLDPAGQQRAGARHRRRGVGEAVLTGPAFPRPKAPHGAGSLPCWVGDDPTADEGDERRGRRGCVGGERVAQWPRSGAARPSTRRWSAAPSSATACPPACSNSTTTPAAACSTAPSSPAPPPSAWARASEELQALWIGLRGLPEGAGPGRGPARRPQGAPGRPRGRRPGRAPRRPLGRPAPAGRALRAARAAGPRLHPGLPDPGRGGGEHEHATYAKVKKVAVDAEQRLERCSWTRWTGSRPRCAGRAPWPTRSTSPGTRCSTGWPGWSGTPPSCGARR